MDGDDPICQGREGIGALGAWSELAEGRVVIHEERGPCQIPTLVPWSEIRHSFLVAGARRHEAGVKGGAPERSEAERPLTLAEDGTGSAWKEGRCRYLVVSPPRGGGRKAQDSSRLGRAVVKGDPRLGCQSSLRRVASGMELCGAQPGGLHQGRDLAGVRGP